MQAPTISVNDRGVVRVQLAGMDDEVMQASGEARGHACAAAGGEVEYLYSIPSTPPRGFDWCRDYVFGRGRRPLLPPVRR